MPAYRTHIEREKLTIRHMVEIYCRGRRHSATEVCADCAELIRYAHERIDMCSYSGSVKPVCGLCRTDCFSTDMHHRFTLIMLHAAPRMLMRHPILTMAHLCDAVRWKLKG